MSEQVGNKLPPPLRFELGNIAEYERANAALLVSVDEDGTPRVAVVSASEITSPDEHTLHIRVHAGSRTSQNLGARGHAVLWTVLDAAAYSVRGTVTVAAEGDEEWRTFELHVQAVLRDFQPDAPLMSGPTCKRL